MTSTSALRFNPSWLELPEFKDWLVSVSNDSGRAYCRWCAVVLRAHKADLTTHSTTVRHIKNESTGSGPAGPISVQIIANDADEEQLPSRTSAPSPAVHKRYRPEWEGLPEFKKWLTQCSTDSSKAYCTICDLQLRAHKHDLVIHGKSTKHKRMEELNHCMSMDGNNSEGGGGDNFSTPTFTTTTTLTRNSTGQFITPTVISVDLEEDERNGVEDDHDVETDWTPSSLPPTPSKASPTSKKAKLESLLQRRPGTTFTAADVVRAIERDEFTGYQLLTIVKAAVPKL